MSSRATRKAVKRFDVAFELRRALDESVKLQSHYASLLNQYDGGKRLLFKDSQEWMQRLKKLQPEEDSKA